MSLPSALELTDLEFRYTGNGRCIVDTGRSKELVIKAGSVIQAAQQEPQEEARAKPQPVVRTATREQFDKVHKKIKTVHAGLFRRLAK